LFPAEVRAQLVRVKPLKDIAVTQRGYRELLTQFLAGGNLAGLQKCLDELAFAANGHAGKFLEPLAVRHFGFGAEPIRHQPKLISGNVAAADAVKQMIEEVGRKIVAPNLRHG
jgi:hypothetical protein